ncbi:hypothetical protein LQL77_30570 [Rhodococcus cerastii]|nr:hypothetical protein [Rhodococcus cerastii]
MASVAADITPASRSDAVPAAASHVSQYTRPGGGFFTVWAPMEANLYRLIFGRLAGEDPSPEVPVAAEDVYDSLESRPP